MCNLMRRSAMAAVVCLASASAGRAQGLPDFPTGTVLTEVMMDVQSTEAQLYGTLLGSSLSPQTLSGTSTTDVAAASFTFSLSPGSTYLGQAISDSVTGQYNTTDGSYDWIATGSGHEPGLGGQRQHLPHRDHAEQARGAQIVHGHFGPTENSSDTDVFRDGRRRDHQCAR